MFVNLLLINLIFSNAFAKDKLGKYSKCIKDFGTMNNTAVHKCASEVSQYLKLQIENKIKELGNTEIRHDFKKFLQSDDHWMKHMELQCELQTRYIGSPMLHYCPMTKLEKRLEELEMLLDGVSK